MKALKKGLCLAVALAVVMQVFSFVPVMAEEAVTAVELGEPAYTYNVVQGDPNAVTDGDTGTVWDFDRQRLGATWISALVYDAGEGMTFDFNRITLNGTGCRFYGADDEGSLSDIGAVLDADTDYSGDDGYQAFADALGIEPIGWLTNGNNWLDGDYDCEDVLSYRYFVVVPYTGWTHARVGEVALSLAEQVSEPETRTVTFDEKAQVTVDGETVLSGESVEVGKTLVITPVIPDGEELVSVSVNGVEIEEPYEYGVADEDIVITVTTQAVGPQEPQYLQELGEPACGFNRHGGDPAAMTDGDPDTAYNFGRGGTGPSWIVAEVYDAGNINKFQFNKASLIGTGVYIYGTDDEGQLADIGAALEAETDYSTDPALFADALGVDLVCALQPADANRGGEAEWTGDTAEYR